MRAVLIVGFALLPGSALAVDKSGYSFSNRTPDELLRPLTTDRPDATESPITVDAGRVQIEMSVAQYTRDRLHPGHADLHVSEWNVAPVNVRLGFTHDTELQIVVDNYLHIEERSAEIRRRWSGWGDVTLRLKRNLTGNDGGDTAVALMPFIKLPTNSGGVGNDRVEGGLIVPASVTFAGREFGVMTEVDFVHDGESYSAQWLNTIATGFDVNDRLGGFIELASLVGDGPHALTFNTGLTLSVHDNLQLDAGTNFGITRAAPDFAIFAGVSVRY